MVKHGLYSEINFILTNIIVYELCFLTHFNNSSCSSQTKINLAELIYISLKETILAIAGIVKQNCPAVGVYHNSDFYFFFLCEKTGWLSFDQKTGQVVFLFNLLHLIYFLIQVSIISELWLIILFTLNLCHYAMVIFNYYW